MNTNATVETEAAVEPDIREYKIRAVNTTEYEFTVFAASVDDALGLAQSGDIAPETIDQDMAWSTWSAHHLGHDDYESGTFDPPVTAVHFDFTTRHDAESFQDATRAMFRVNMPSVTAVAEGFSCTARGIPGSNIYRQVDQLAGLNGCVK